MPDGRKRLEHIYLAHLRSNICPGYKANINNLGHLWATPGSIRNARLQRHLLDHGDRVHPIDSALLFPAEFQNVVFLLFLLKF